MFYCFVDSKLTKMMMNSCLICIATLAINKRREICFGVVGRQNSVAFYVYIDKLEKHN